MFEFLHIYFVQYRTDEGPIIDHWRPIFFYENVFDSNNLLYTLQPMNGKEAGKQKLEIAVTHYPLYAALSLLLCSSGGEKILQGVKNLQKIFSKTFDAHYPCVFYSRTMAPSPSVAMHYQSRGLEWILLQTNTYFNTLKSRCYFFRISHYLCVFQINQPYYFRSDSVVKCSI